MSCCGVSPCRQRCDMVVELPLGQSLVRLAADETGTRGAVTITLLGDPVPFARMRLARGGAHFIPQKQRNTMAAMKILAQQQMGFGQKPFDCPIRLELLAEFSIPRAFSRRKRDQALLGQLLPAKRPDLDNLYKLAADALNGVVYRDDSLICVVHMRKRYGEQPKLTVTVSPCFAALA